MAEKQNFVLLLFFYLNRLIWVRWKWICKPFPDIPFRFHVTLGQRWSEWIASESEFRTQHILMEIQFSRRQCFHSNQVDWVLKTQLGNMKPVWNFQFYFGPKRTTFEQYSFTLHGSGYSSKRKKLNFHQTENHHLLISGSNFLLLFSRNHSRSYWKFNWKSKNEKRSLGRIFFNFAQFFHQRNKVQQGGTRSRNAFWTIPSKNMLFFPIEEGIVSNFMVRTIFHLLEF